ncbi:hypothetical protein DLM46_01685 [Paraburkholderia lacunae]|uniref:Uncharacterized protein n=2 Tax=Paraburkholderia lacunae TaxID=2211104 RepID=A0A370NG65_9BURK|nr:hypothetical protein DLM46_01685 [Paraburkholderia lacunae]
MKIHFAFGSDAKTGNINSQAEKTLEYILIPKRLRGSTCEEFIPAFPNPNSLWGDIGNSKIGSGNGIVIENWKRPPPVSFLPNQVCMFCMTDIPFRKLASSPHSGEYGKLGIAFTNQFIKRMAARPVLYYEIDDLKTDPLVLQYHEALEKHSETLDLLRRQLLTFRKPAKLWPDFLESKVAKIEIINGQAELSVSHYSRYPVGYDFTKEHEVRICLQADNPYIDFSEEDVQSLIAPNEHIAMMLRRELETKWKAIPEILIFPQN